MESYSIVIDGDPYMGRYKVNSQHGKLVCIFHVYNGLSSGDIKDTKEKVILKIRPKFRGGYPVRDTTGNMLFIIKHPLMYITGKDDALCDKVGNLLYKMHSEKNNTFIIDPKGEKVGNVVQQALISPIKLSFDSKKIPKKQALILGLFFTIGSAKGGSLW